ncbi:MAG: hypothetical protein HQM10_19955 [Candidatus Riflebacteria bacterium]|nr:hypothetical protein [Candidatus Riflebacteria bacterium]
MKSNESTMPVSQIKIPGSKIASVLSDHEGCFLQVRNVHLPKWIFDTVRKPSQRAYNLLNPASGSVLC